MNQSYKQKVFDACLKLVNERISTAQQAVKNAQSSANEESRSTAGDKYDTARSMSQLDSEMHAKQLREALNLKKTLDHISPDKQLNTAEVGAIVEVNDQKFFIAVSLGKLSIDNENLLVISPMTPLAQCMLGKRGGETYIFNNKSFTISSVQ